MPAQSPSPAATLAARLVAWERSHATPEQQAVWADSPEPYNLMLDASPYSGEYEQLTQAEQYEFWEAVDQLYT